ncbi:MAG: hypothetical protein FWF12_04070 [Betaproteobacteria bacterium]|nr:hypothetical protein [Betaproteobacteria bacterium]
MIRFLLLFFWSATCWAAGFSVDLQKVSLPDFLRVVYGELLRKSYILDAPVVSDGETFTLVLRDISELDIEKELHRVLELRGYRIEEERGVIVVRKGVDKFLEEVFFYRPLHRSVTYLMPLVESLFKPGSFVQRGGGAVSFNQISGSSELSDSSSFSSPSFSSGQGQLGQGGQRSLDNANSGLNRQLSIDQDVIVFKGSEKDIERFKKLVAQVDIPSAELLVKAVVLEVQNTETNGSAVDLIASFIKSKIGFGINLAAGASDSSNVFARLSLGGFDVSAIYSALSGDSRFKVLTSPRLRVKSGSSARFSVGNETPILGSVSYDSNNRPIQNVTYKPSGVIFELRPTIKAASSEISVMQQISQFSPTTNGVNDSPTLIKRELRTEIVAVDGDVVLLGGLDEQKDTGTSSGLSFLPSWFRSSKDERSNTEIVLMLFIERVRSVEGGI